MAPGSRPATLPLGAVAEFLASTTLFRQVDRGVIDKVAPHLPLLEHDAGAVIVRAGTLDGAMGVLVSGRAAVRQINAATGAATVLEQVRVGDSFGEVAALLGTAQAYELVAEDTCTTLTVGKDVMAQLLGKVAPFAHALARRSAMRSVQASVAALRGGGEPAPTVSPSGRDLAPVAAVDDGSLRIVRVSGFEINDKLLALIPNRTMAMHRLLPLELRGTSLTVGMVDPWNGPVQNELRRLLVSVELSFVAISVDDYNEAFVRLRIDPGTSGRVQVAAISPDSIQYDLNVDEPPAKQAAVIGDEVVQLANRIIAAAIDRQASDVHIEGEPTAVRVRFRIGGVLQDWESLVAASFAKGLVARFKVLAGLDITERRVPQDGRIGLRVARREIDLRVSTMPTLRGEKIVLRVFEAANMTRPLEQIFIEPRTLAMVRSALDRPYGAIVVAGPTGSGKSSSLYACLNERRKARPDTNTVTVEDPIEYRLGGASRSRSTPAPT
ncbi:MAG: Flp pilus assembly complex ATPase component TadA [Myxococcales bacterium]|nr:Flp pilus assembly complex ATPase component TadA [Myxococcales bacterium]